MKKSLNSFPIKSFSLNKKNHKQTKLYNKMTQYKSNKINNRFYSPKNNNNNIIINSYSSLENTNNEYLTSDQNKTCLSNKSESLKNNNINSIYTSKFYMNKELKPFIYSSGFLLDEVINKDRQRIEQKKNKIKKKILQKANAFLFSKKNKQNIPKINKENVNERDINKENRKAFTYSSDNKSMEFLKRGDESTFFIRKNLFPKTQRDSKFRKIKYVGDLLRNNNPMFKRLLMKQKERSEKLLFDIRKAQSMEIKNIQLGLALLKTKNKAYKVDRMLKYKYN